MANLLRKDRNASYATSSIGQATGSMYHTGGAKKLTRVPFRPWEIAPLWIENVAREEATRKKWENMYGWLADYDAKGNFKPKQQSLENRTRFTDRLPNSNGHDYGWHLETDHGKDIKLLQKRYDIQHKRRPIPHGLGYE